MQKLQALSWVCDNSVSTQIFTGRGIMIFLDNTSMGANRSNPAMNMFRLEIRRRFLTRKGERWGN